MNDLSVMPAADEAIDGLRREIDAIDDALHDLLMRRTEVVARIGALKQADGGDGVFLRPGREAVVLRRLVARHRGPLPKATVVRIWRELMGALVRLQGPFAVAVFSPEQAPGYWDLARDHFGGLSPMAAHESAGQVLRAVMEGQATVGVLPLPEQDEEEPWWRHLLGRDPRTPRIVARLPFVAPVTVRGGPLEAYAVGLAPAEETGEDRSLFALETAAQISRSGLTVALRSVGLETVAIQVWRDRGNPESQIHLVEVEGFVAAEDRRLAALAGSRGEEIRQVWTLGSFAVPLAPAELGAARG